MTQSCKGPIVAEQSTTGNKIWLISMHPRNFGSDEITPSIRMSVRTTARPPRHVSGCEMSQFCTIQSMFNLILDINVIVY